MVVLGKKNMEDSDSMWQVLLRMDITQRMPHEQ